MKLLMLSLVAAAAALMSPLASAHPVTLTGTLSGAAESPANNSTGFGHVTVVFDDDAWTMRVAFDYADLVGTSTAAHIHCCTALANAGTAGVATQVPRFFGMVTGVHSGSYDNTFDMTLASSWNPAFVIAQGSIADAFAALSSGFFSESAYLNIHSTTVPGGEIRAFLHVTTVPEPESYALVLGALLVLCGTTKRRAQI
jgi:hypothetical protein